MMIIKIGVVCLDQQVVSALQELGAPPGYLVPNHKKISSILTQGLQDVNVVKAA